VQEWWAWCASDAVTYDPVGRPTPTGGATPRTATATARGNKQLGTDVMEMEDGIVTFGCSKSEGGVFCAKLFSDFQYFTVQGGQVAPSCPFLQSCCIGEFIRFVTSFRPDFFENDCPGVTLAAQSSCKDI
jgi:hypothetical protein